MPGFPSPNSLFICAPQLCVQSCSFSGRPTQAGITVELQALFTDQHKVRPTQTDCHVAQPSKPLPPALANLVVQQRNLGGILLECDWATTATPRPLPVQLWQATASLLLGIEMHQWRDAEIHSELIWCRELKASRRHRLAGRPQLACGQNLCHSPIFALRAYTQNY